MVPCSRLIQQFMYLQTFNLGFIVFIIVPVTSHSSIQIFRMRVFHLFYEITYSLTDLLD